MLTLTRNVNEKIIIDTGKDVIEVWPAIISESSRQVKLCVKAPKNVIIDREEVYLRRQASKNKQGEQQ